MNILKAALLSSAVLIALPQPNVLAQEKKTAQELLDELNKVAPRGQTRTLPSPTTTTTIDADRSTGGGGGGNRALRNLEKEESGRTQRQILEQLK